MRRSRPAPRRTSAARIFIAALAVTFVTVAAPAAHAADADMQNAVTLNQLDGFGNEIPITAGGVYSVSYDTTNYTLQAGEAPRTGCEGFGNRTAWVRFVPGVRGRLMVTASAAYDVMLFSYFTTTQLGETAFDEVNLKTDNCNNATTGPNETNMPVPWDSAQNSGSRVQPGQMVLLQSASWCGSPPGCTGGAGGPTTLTVNFIPDDADGDGTPDTIDDCPNASGDSGYEGCPDSDSDGIRDIDDACPATAGSPSVSGCPDRDGDGVRDGDDACADTFGSAAYGGCPDSDGDTVRDIDDACVTVAGDPQNRGCLLDSDSDGVPDQSDACPETRGISADGCPDRDGDGVRDIDDLCKDVPGDRPGGCPADGDRDGVPDRDDNCPRVAGNGVNGCPENIEATFPHDVAVVGSLTRILKLRVRAPRGATVRLSCTRGLCARRTLRIKRRTTNLLSFLRTRTARAGARIVIRVTLPRAIGNTRTFVFRSAALPRKITRCHMPSGRRTSCS